MSYIILHWSFVAIASDAVLSETDDFLDVIIAYPMCHCNLLKLYFNCNVYIDRQLLVQNYVRSVQPNKLVGPHLFARRANSSVREIAASQANRASAYGTPLDGATVKVVITTVNKT